MKRRLKTAHTKDEIFVSINQTANNFLSNKSKLFLYQICLNILFRGNRALIAVSFFSETKVFLFRFFFGTVRLFSKISYCLQRETLQFSYILQQIVR